MYNLFSIFVSGYQSAKLLKSVKISVA